MQRIGDSRGCRQARSGAAESDGMIAKQRLYTVNARFSTAPVPDTPYAVVRVDGR